MNLEVELGLVTEASRSDTTWICLPESLRGRGRHDAKPALAEPVPGQLTTALPDAARNQGLWVFAGSFDERSPGPGKLPTPARSA